MVDTPESGAVTDRVPTAVLVSVLLLVVVGVLFALNITVADFVAFWRSDAAFPTTLGLFVLALAIFDWRRRQ